MPLIFTIIFSILSLIYFEYIPTIINSFKLSTLGKYIYGFFNQRFLIEFFYNKFIVNFVLELGGQTTTVLDKGSIEYMGPFGLEKGLIKLSKNINNLNTSIITDYALYISIGFIVYGIIFNISGIINVSQILLIIGLFFINNK